MSKTSQYIIEKLIFMPPCSRCLREGLFIPPRRPRKIKDNKGQPNQWWNSNVSCETFCGSVQYKIFTAERGQDSPSSGFFIILADPKNQEPSCYSNLVEQLCKDGFQVKILLLMLECSLEDLKDTYISLLQSVKSLNHTLEVSSSGVDRIFVLAFGTFFIPCFSKSFDVQADGYLLVCPQDEDGKHQDQLQQQQQRQQLGEQEQQHERKEFTQQVNVYEKNKGSGYVYFIRNFLGSMSIPQSIVKMVNQIWSFTSLLLAKINGSTMTWNLLLPSILSSRRRNQNSVIVITDQRHAWSDNKKQKLRQKLDQSSGLHNQISFSSFEFSNINSSTFATYCLSFLLLD